MEFKHQLRLGMIILAVVGVNLFLQRPEKTSALIHHSTAASFAADIGADQLVLVDFHADWCGPCKAQQGALNRLADERRAVRICKLDTEAYPAVAAEQAVPDRRARCPGKEKAGPDADDPAAPVAVPREHDRREARRRETGAGRDAAGVAAA